MDHTNPNVLLNGATFNPSDGSPSGPDFVNRNDLGILIAAGGDYQLLPLDAIAADDSEPYRWTAPYNDALISALSGDVTVALVGRDDPSVRWTQGGIVTERTRLSVVTVDGVEEGGVEKVIGEDYTFNLARQRLMRVAGNLPSGAALIVHYVGDRARRSTCSRSPRW